MPVVGIILLAVGLVALAIVGFILYKFVFSRRYYEKQVKYLQNKYSYLNALMIGQDSQYIKRLEMISRTNLLYGEMYDTYMKKYRHIIDVEDSYAAASLKQLKNLIEAKQFRDIKAQINEGRKAVESYEISANSLDAELRNIIKPEEEARSSALVLKTKLRSVKQTYNVNSTDLTLVSESFDKVFDKLDGKFAEFENLVEGASYDEANAILPVVDKILTQLESTLEVMPSLCILLTNVIPEKIRDLHRETDDMNFNQYPIYHLLVSQHFDEWDNKIQELKLRLINLQIKGVKEEADKVQEDIATIHQQYQDEIEAKTFFEENISITYQNVSKLENNFLKICSLIPETKTIYKFEEIDDTKVSELKSDVAYLGTLKRTLDTFVHSSTKQPYTILKEKLSNLINEYQEVNQRVENFKIYLESLKNNSEEAYNLVFSYYYRLKQCEQKISSVGVEEYDNKYKEQIEECYSMLDKIDKLVKEKPINVNLLNEQVEEFKNTANKIFENVDNDANIVRLAESAILLANRDRNHQADVHQQLKQCEEQFYRAEFEQTYRDVIQLLKRKHVEDN